MLRSVRNFQRSVVAVNKESIGAIDSLDIDVDRWRATAVWIRRSGRVKAGLPAEFFKSAESIDRGINLKLDAGDVKRLSEALERLSVTSRPGSNESEGSILNTNVLLGKHVALGVNSVCIRDIIFDDCRLDIESLVVGMRRWLRSRGVLISPRALERQWGVRELFCARLDQDEFGALPVFDPSHPVNRIDGVWFDYFGRRVHGIDI